jgi:FAD/FMN-containing dehydrogenase/Fe-S oxidoreductase
MLADTLDANQRRVLLSGADCEVHFDTDTRRLYATDASLYQIEPAAVAFPRSADQVQSLMRAAGEAEIGIIPRGAGTGLAGGAIGAGVIIDLSRYNRGITEFNKDARTVRVEPGVVLDQLNAYLKPHGLCFGPDVATSSRATLGGMIANNSSGAHVPVYGTTVDSIVSLDVVMPDGTLHVIGGPNETIGDLRGHVRDLVEPHAATVREVLHDGIKKRWHGYAFDHLMKSDWDLTRLISGSEGTLATITSALLKVTTLPKQKGLGLIYFETIAEAMQATVELLELNPAAIEHIDDTLFNQTRGQILFKAGRDLLDLDTRPSKSILIVEFFDNVNEKLDLLSKKKLGVRKLILTDEKQQNLVWSIRKAGLSLLTGCKGAAKPVAGIEDSAVRPSDLPEYVAAIERVIRDITGKEGSFYGHAAAGLLHIRPVIDMHDPVDVGKYRKLCEEADEIVHKFKGSIAGEHGVGMAHTEFLERQIGPELTELSRRVKAAFDPDRRMNPGKIVAGPENYRIDTNLRMGPNYALPLPFKPVLMFAAKDESFVGNLEQCNGCGGCRKDAPTMCPTFVATGDELMSTRGRANALRNALEGKLHLNGHVLNAPLVEEALSTCLSCKACKSECPSNVDLALLKAEWLHARHEIAGVPLRDRVFSRVDFLGMLGCIAPTFANAMIRWPWLRKQMKSFLGIAAERPLPPYAIERFDRWFAHREAPTRVPRGEVILWDDTFVRYNEPNIGKAATAVLEAAGFNVELVRGRKCCGRPAFSLGMLDTARDFGKRNLELLSRPGDTRPILFLEPSCYSMFAEDYRELGLPNALEVARRCQLFEYFVNDLLEKDPGVLPFQEGYSWVAIHAHCHAKALTDTNAMVRLARHLPNSTVTMLNTGCCGMAGAFGAIESKYELSLKVARPLVQQIQSLTAGTHVVASGTSCRHQIDHLTDAKPLHMAELLAEHLTRR